eukprot:1157374-Pelagomonas_calceolata.AAC.4
MAENIGTEGKRWTCGTPPPPTCSVQLVNYQSVARKLLLSNGVGGMPCELAIVQARTSFYSSGACAQYRGVSMAKGISWTLF